MPVGGAGERRRGRGFVTALAVLACALAAPPVACAELFTVNSIGDEVDAAPGTGGCLTAGNKCTLRAAIEESNVLGGDPEPDEVVFDETLFNGQLSGTIALGSSLPAMTKPARIGGSECSTAAGVNGPCVGIDGSGAAPDPALVIDDADEVEIEGLSVTGAGTGIGIDSSESVVVRGSWFGVKLDGSAGGNATGIFIGPGSDASRIGGEGANARNLFANNADEGLDVLGVANVRVLGNYFGVNPDGTTAAPNGKDIEVTSASAGGFEAIGTAIGTRVSSLGVATPACDRGCNLISGSASSGVDLEGDDASEVPAVATTIAGNYLGLDATGTASVPNASAGILVGTAAQTVIGGPKAGEANRINGGSTGVSAGPAASDLVVRGNSIGVDASGTESLAPPGEGVVVNSAGLSSPAVEAVIADNEIGMEGGVAIAQRGLGARISGNEIFGAETGIRTFESTAKHGNLIEGNFIEGVEGSGILVENNLNEILANEIFGTGGAGIWIQGSVPAGVTENLVGGDAATQENVITGSGADAIKITNVKATANEVARNRGFGNVGLFINLVSASPGEPIGPNNGIEPPGFSTSAQTSASGSDAEAGANVRVFSKQAAATGEIESFLGEAIADSEGNWEVVYGEAVPAGTIVAATQTSAAGGTSELSTATTTGESASEGGGGGGGSGGGGGATGNAAGTVIGPHGPADETLPQTRILKALQKGSQGDTAQFKFASNEFGATFKCKLDHKPFRACRSPKSYVGLKPGEHVFRVRAIDSAGNADSSPARRKFTVLSGGAG